MKYDSSMTRFHGDIVAAIKSMIYGQEETVMKLASDGSPAPMREYLKEQHGKCSHGGNKFNCTPQNFSVRFDAIINNLGDKDLTLSWSQVATFIRNNTAEVFGDSNDESDDDEEDIIPDKASLEALVDTFDESEIECPFWRTGETLDYKSFGGVDFKCACHEMSFCEFGAITTFLATHCHNYNECRYYNKFRETDSPCDNSITVDKQIPTAFDYSTLDTDTANNLRQCETVIRQETAGYFTLLGAKFKEAQDLLANHSTGTFEQWYTAMGFKRQTVYNLIQRFEFSSSPKIEGREDAFEALPLTLSYEISKPTAPAELVDKVLEGDITSNAEYQKLKAELERTKVDLRNVERNFDEREKLRQKLGDENVKLRIKIQEQDKELKMVSEKDTEISALQQRIEELENRPIDVAVQTDEAALAEKDEEIAELKEQLERLLDKEVKAFAIKLTLDEYEELLDMVGGSPKILSAVKKAHILKV